MKTHVERATCVSRGKIGVVILICGAIAVAGLYHIRRSAFDNPDRTVNLPLPKTALTLEPMTPVALSPTQASVKYVVAATCNVEAVNGEQFDKEFELSQGTRLGISGWLIDSHHKTEAKQAWILIRNDSTGEFLRTPITLRTRRPDVQEALGGAAGYLYAGFLSQLNTDTLSKGKYRLMLVYGDSEREYICDNGRYFDVNPN